MVDSRDSRSLHGATWGLALLLGVIAWPGLVSAQAIYVQPGLPSEGSTSLPGGDLNITGGPAVGTSEPAPGGNVVINGGAGLNAPPGNIILGNIAGNVGIGTTSPQNALHVRSAGVQQLMLEGNSSWTQMGMKWSTNNFWTIGIGAAGGNNFFILDQNATYRFSIDQAGNIGIGQLGVAGGYIIYDATTGAGLTSGGVWQNASSRAYKTDIVPLTEADALDAVTRLTPVTFLYTRNPGERHVGFIAEDVPELVASDDRKGLSAMDIVAVLTKVVQEQQKEIDQIRAELNSYRKVVGTR